MLVDELLDKEKGEEYGFKSKKILHSKYEQVDVWELCVKCQLQIDGKYTL
jgi:hypothetical protein